MEGVAMTKPLSFLACLVVAVLASMTIADQVRGQTTSFKVVGGPFVVAGGSVYWLDSSNVPLGWKLLPNGSFSLPPIDPTNLAFYNGITAITESGEGWVKSGGEWMSVGPIPGTPTVKRSWGQVKTKYMR